MKKLMLLFCLLASFIACSDDKDTPEEPKMPITDLTLPTVNPIAGDNVTIAGKGFAQDCKIQVKPEGAETAVDVTIVEVTDAGITFKAPAELTGKCKVILLQGGKSYELGDLTFDEAPDVEATLYGVFADETTTSVCPIDAITQRRGKALFTLDYEPEGIIADNHGIVYYRVVAYDGDGKFKGFELRYYDMKAKQDAKIDWEGALNCFSISTDGEKLYALTYETEEYTISLYSVDRDGSATPLNTYDDITDGDGYVRLYSTGGTFLCGEDYLFAGINVDMGGSTFPGEIVAGLSEEGYISFNAAAELDKSYRFVKANEKYYAFLSNAGEEATPGAGFVKFDNEGDWDEISGRPVETTIDDYFTNQVYDPTTGLIYGMFGEGDDGNILPFDPKTDKVLDPWMGSGCVALLYIKAQE